MKNRDTSDDLGVYLYDDIPILSRIRTQNNPDVKYWMAVFPNLNLTLVNALLCLHVVNLKLNDLYLS